MLYSDILFVFAFLPVMLALMFILREPWEKNLAAVVASLVFLCWGRQLYYALIILLVFAVYLAGRLIKKNNSKGAYIAGAGSALLFSLVCVLSLANDHSLAGWVCAVGFMLFAARAFVYLNEVKNGADAETDFLSLAVYLISYEFMLISPLEGYTSLKEDIKSRKLSLSKVAAGLEGFIFGLARVTVLGFAFERVRQAALFGETMPWMNSLIGVAASAVEIYILFAGFCEMSHGLALMGGISLPNCVVSIGLKSSVTAHVVDFYEGGVSLFKKNFAGGKNAAWGLVLASVIVGLCFGAGSGACAFLGILLLMMMLESLSETKTFADGIIAVIVLLAGYFVLATASAEGVGNFISSLNKNAYEFDISYALYSEIMRSVFWLALGAISITPVYKWIYTFIREKMASSEKAYAAFRCMGAVVTVLLLVLSTVAMVSAI
ncbi:MAG: hypothetical protein IJ424_03055 [Oscillospiraceae bacterium]|nr:hypothetical protein [Oscillospiraceae bacterium]